MNHHGLRRTSNASVEPVSLAEAKEYLRVDHSDEDSLINGLIQSAREECEKYTHLSLLSQQWTITAQDIPSCGLELPRPPMISIDTVHYRDSDNAWQEWTEYHNDLFQEPSRLYLKSSPSVSSTLPDRWKVVYTAGYGDRADDVPATLVSAIKLIVKSLYEREEDGGPLRDAANRLMNLWRIPNPI